MQTTNDNNQQAIPVGHDTRNYLKAKNYGFGFKEAESLANERLEKKESIIADLGEKPQPYKVILSYTCIGIGLVFAGIEATNVQATIIGATGISENIAILIGFGFAASGLVAGEMLGSKASWKKDEFSGAKRPTPKFFVALGFSIIYLLGQYFLASRAAIGTDQEAQETVTTMKWFVLGIAAAELLFGLAFLSTALKVLTLTTANLFIKLATGKMKRQSKACEEAWQRYSFDNNGENLLDETPAIRDARRFYSEGGSAYYSSTQTP